MRMAENEEKMHHAKTIKNPLEESTFNFNEDTSKMEHINHPFQQEYSLDLDNESLNYSKNKFYQDFAIETI
jgi:hypothetical protein